MFRDQMRQNHQKLEKVLPAKEDGVKKDAALEIKKAKCDREGAGSTVFSAASRSG